MRDTNTLITVLRDRAGRKLGRRDFLKQSGGMGAGLLGGLSLSACGQSSDDDDDMASPDGPSDADILNFALNLEYLEAQYYQFAANGAGLSMDMMGGTGAQGMVIGGRMVSFSDPVVAQYAREIAQDEMNHVRFLRSALGSAAVAQPAIDIGTDPNGAFSSAARAAGLIGEGESFDPYASDENFLLGAYLFEDVGVTAYKGASPLIRNKAFLEAAAGILAAEAYHAGLVRTVLYAKGVEMPALRDATVLISEARDGLDGTDDVDQGVIGDTPEVSNIVPLDADGIAFSRSPGDVLNIVYLSTEAVGSGGFFPDGVNGALSMSSALA